MNSFMKTLIMVFSIILVISLTIIGLVMYYDKHKYTFPPKVSACPDYWVDSNFLKSGDNAEQYSDSGVDASTLGTDMCVNVKKLGVCQNQKVMNFNESPYNDSGTSGPTSGACAKAKWAKKCRITWDGISNNPDICS